MFSPKSHSVPSTSIVAFQPFLLYLSILSRWWSDVWPKDTDDVFVQDQFVHDPSDNKMGFCVFICEGIIPLQLQV